MRAAGTGVVAGIEYEQVGQMGVFVFASLDIEGGNIGFVGARPRRRCRGHPSGSSHP